MNKRLTCKAIIVMEFISTGYLLPNCVANTASPTIFQDWKDKFLQGGRQAILNKREDQKSRKGGRESQVHGR